MNLLLFNGAEKEHNFALRANYAPYRCVGFVYFHRGNMRVQKRSRNGEEERERERTEIFSWIEIHNRALRAYIREP